MDDPSAVTPGLGNLVKEYPMSSARMREILLLMLFSAWMTKAPAAEQDGI